MTTSFYHYGTLDARHTKEGIALILKPDGVRKITPVLDQAGFAPQVFVNFTGSLSSRLVEALDRMGYEFRRPYEYKPPEES